MKEMMEFNFHLNDLNIHSVELYQELGYSQQHVPEPIEETVKGLLISDENSFSIRGGWKFFDSIHFDNNDDAIVIADRKFFVGEKIKKQLIGSELIALMCATAGPELENLSRKKNREGDPLTSFILDSLGSLIAEKTADKMRDLIKQKADHKGMKITNRYSPGYCSWNVEEQCLFFSLLPDHYCGIQLSESALMIPIKSVSAVIGIGKNVRYSDYQCELCDQVNCLKRTLRRNNNQ